MNNQLLDFYNAKGIAYYDTPTPCDKLLTINDAEAFVELAETEQIPILGTEVFQKTSKCYTFDFAWSCEENKSEDISYKSYFDRSIVLAKNKLDEIREIIEKSGHTLYINSSFASKKKNV